jgi:hypothetical protein
LNKYFKENLIKQGVMRILLKDHKNRLIQEMNHLTDKTELLISENVVKMNSKGFNLNIETLTEEVTEYWIEQGYKHDNALYERLILEYNQNNDDLLPRWI